MTDGARPGRVLVVEDETDIREVLLEILVDHGYEAVGAEHGRAALDYLESAPKLPDLILLDLLMPVLDGERFRTEQMKDPRCAAIATVVISANARVREAAERMGVAAWLKKPLDLDDLMRAIELHSGHPSSM